LEERVNPVIAESEASAAARHGMLADRGEPLFYANWDHAVFIHYESDPRALQKCVPFALDLNDGRAFVSVVAFTLRRMRPRRGGRLTELLLRPIATHHLFNVRTYVRHNGERAIYFMAEWLSNRLSVALGPGTFGLPYRYGKLEYHNEPGRGEVQGQVDARDGTFSYRAGVPADSYKACDSGSLAEFLLERYTAFTSAGRRKRFFRVWHSPWPQTAIDLEVNADELMTTTGKWWPTAHLVAANYSPGVSVWMGWPHSVGASSYEYKTLDC
jgi:uncharacterized protein